MTPKTTSIRIDGLRVRCHVGVPPSERAAMQEVLVDAVVTFANPDIAVDSLSATLNYKKVADDIASLAIGHSWRLLETMAQDIAALILEDARVSEVDLTIKKPNRIPNCDAVGVRRVFTK